MRRNAWLLSLVASALLTTWPIGRARAICRAVEPLDGPGLAFDETTNAMWVQSPDQIIDYACGSGAEPVWPEEPGEDVDAGAPDAGTEGDGDSGSDVDPDAGVDLDAGPDPAADAGIDSNPDAGVGSDPDGGIDSDPDTGSEPADMLDAGAPAARFEPPWRLPESAYGEGRDRPGAPNDGDAGIPMVPGRPYCPDGSELLAIRGTVVSLVVQPLVASGSGRAGLVMPVPTRPDVRLAPSSLFQSVLDDVSSAATDVETEYVQDPSFGWQCYDPHVYARGPASRPAAPSMGPSRPAGALAAGALAWMAATQSTGCGGDEADGAYYRPDTMNRRTSTETVEGGMVTYETFPEIEGVEITVLQASSSEALVSWMDGHGFRHDATDDAAFARYVRDDAWFVAIAIDGTGDAGERALPPIAVTFPSEEIPITHELQYDPSGGLVLTEALIVAPGRMQVEDDSDETEWAVPVVPSGDISGFGLGQAWVTRLSIRREMSQRIVDSRLVAADPVRVEPIEIKRRIRVRIPVACTPENGFDESNCGSQSPSTSRTYAVTVRAGSPDDQLTDGWTTPSVPSSCASYSYGYDEGGYGCVVAGAGVPAGGLLLSGLLVALGVARRRRRRS